VEIQKMLWKEPALKPRHPDFKGILDD